MLVILYGLSCTGKSTIMENLVNYYNFQYINCYTTRKPRINDKGELLDNDKARIYISIDEYKKMENDGEFCLSNNNYGNFYGTPKNEIEIAVNDEDTFYVMDYLIHKRESLKNIKHIKILIAPDSLDSLNKWVIGTTRLERLNEIQEQYLKYYASSMMSLYQEEDFFLITNKFGTLEKTIESVVNYCNKKLGTII